VQQCLHRLTLNSNATTNNNNLIQNENNQHAQVLNPLLAKTKGSSSVRKKGHFEKRKRPTTKAKKIKGEKLDKFYNEIY